MKLKEFTEDQIIERKEMYMERLEQLWKAINDYMDKPDAALGYKICEEYKSLKEEICAEKKYLNCNMNDISKKSKTHKAYDNGIKDASAYGFSKRINGKIDQNMLSAIEEASYRLNKYFVAERLCSYNDSGYDKLTTL